MTVNISNDNPEIFNIRRVVNKKKGGKKGTSKILSKLRKT